MDTSTGRRHIRFIDGQSPPSPASLPHPPHASAAAHPNHPDHSHFSVLHPRRITSALCLPLMCAFCFLQNPKADFSYALRVIVLMVLAAKGFLMLFWTRSLRRPFAVSGIRCLNPQAKQRVPFVRGCVPIDTDSSHDKNRVRVLKTANG